MTALPTSQGQKMSASAQILSGETNGDAPSLLDLQHLHRQTMGDNSLMREVLTLFRGHARDCVKALNEARIEQDWRMAAHTLKGTARTIGAFELAGIARQAEILTIAAEASQRAALLATLATSLTRTDEEIRRLLPAD